MNWLLIAVAVILLGNALVGMKVGFIKTVFSLVSLILALFLTIWVSPLVKEAIKSNEKLSHSISDKIEKMLPFEDKAAQGEQQELIEGLSVPQTVKEGLLKDNTAAKYKELAATSFKEYVSRYLTEITINAMAFIVTFIVILILLWVVFLALHLISKLPLLNELNKTAGLLAGLVHGLLLVWLFFILLTVFSSTEFVQSIMRLVEENEILSIIYNNNILLKLITGATKILFVKPL